MPRRRKEEPRALGPTWIPSRQQWRVTSLDPRADGGRGERNDRWFRGLAEAEAWRRTVDEKLARLSGITFAPALDMYEQELKERGNAEVSWVETMRRLRLFFHPVGASQVARLRADRAGELYAAFRTGRSVDYHRNALGNAKGFLAWCVERRVSASNPLNGIKGIGKRGARKRQLTGDEARRFHVTALRLADQGDDGALAADMLLLMGLRQSEVRKRRVRDLDLGGTVLRVEGAKTVKGNRIIYIPDVLRQPLLEQAEDRSQLAVLFPAADEGEHTRAWLYFAVRRVCLAAGVPIVCPHGLRGTHATLALELGLGAKVLADQLGHTDPRTTLRHYAEPGAGDGAAGARVLAVIQGGRAATPPGAQDAGRGGHHSSAESSALTEGEKRDRRKA